MFIVVEGCDGSGKTTLIEALKEKIGDSVEVWNRGVPTAHPLAEYEVQAEDYAPGSGRDVITDRWHVGELIYGPIYRGGSGLDAAGVLHVELFLMARGALVVFKDCPLDVVKERLAHRGEDFLEERHIQLVLLGYRLQQTLTRLPNVVIGQNTTAQVVNSIMGRAKLIEARATRGLAPGEGLKSYIGHPCPQVMLLADRRNIGPRSASTDPHHKAALLPYPGSCGAWLFRELLAHEPDRLLTLGVANAAEEDLEKLWETRGRPKVVAMGREAASAADKAGVPHGTVCHPQFAHRFAGRRGKNYIAHVFQAAKSSEDLLTLSTG